MTEAMQVLVLGPEGSARAGLAQTLTRLGYVVMSAEARPEAPPPRQGQVLVLDARDAGEDWSALAERLRADARPLVVVCDGPRRLVRALAGRPGGTMVMSGAESDAGYRVALSVCAGLAGESPAGVRARVAAR